MQPETEIEVSLVRSSLELLQRSIVQVFQVMLLPALLLLRLLIVRNNLYHHESYRQAASFRDKATYVIYANHQSKLDPLLICAALPLRLTWRLLPFRFFIANEYLRGPLKALLYGLGGFPAHFEQGVTFGLDRARELMATKQSVFIFPPGMRTREHIAKRGISVLAAEPNTRLIPIHIDWKSRLNCHIHVGKPQDGGVTHSPEQLMQRVYDLPSAH